MRTTTISPQRARVLATLEGLVSEQVGTRLAEYASTVDGAHAIVEVGSYKGKSTCYLAEGAAIGNEPAVYAVDPWDLEGNVTGRFGFAEAATREAFVRQVAHAGHSGRVRARQAFSLDAASDWSGPIGLLYLDGSHLYDDVRADFEAWFPHVVERGIVVFDDYRTPKNPGVTRFVDELRAGDLLIEWDYLPPPLASGRRSPPGVPIDVGHRTLVIRFGDPDDHIARIVNGARDFYERDLLEDARARLGMRPGIVVDVGAHVGNHALWFAEVCGRDVIAIEPYEPSFESLEANIAQNGLAGRVMPLPVAVGEGRAVGRMRPPQPGNSGTARLEILVSRTHGHRADGEVLVTTVDDLVAGRTVALLKVDVEGDEPYVLGGASGVLARDRPIVYAEARDAAALAAVRSVLDVYGYHAEGVFGRTPTYVFEAEEGVL